MWHRAALAGLLLAATAPGAPAQEWNDPRTRELVTRATQRRLQQISDTTLRDYRATAHGYLTFLAQLGEGFLLPPKVVKADQLALEVFWRAPNYSKQWIIGRRDTLVLPTDIQYHRDHLGIVQNNFPDIIRLGDGDEVRDVPHPLSSPGLAAYDFSIRDSLRFELPGRVLEVYEVKVRPRDDRAAATVGSVYISREDAQVVRMAFSFTRTALRDRQLEDVSIILENSLIEGRFWLPRRQEIEIRRSGSWMDFPVKGIIRGRWEVRDYTVNAGGTEAVAPGPEIVLAPPQRRAAFRFPPTSIVDSLPADVTLATGEDVRQVQEEARRLVRAQALSRARNTLPSARGVSDLLQVNRVEGIAIGGGIRRQLGGGFDLLARGRFGTADREGKGALVLGWQRADGLQVRISGVRDFRDVGDEAEASRARNSIAAQEFGVDLTQPYRASGVAVRIGAPFANRWRWALEGDRERHEGLQVNAAPASGRFEPTIVLPRRWATRTLFSLERAPAPLGIWHEARFRFEGRAGWYGAGEGAPATTTWRGWGMGEVARALGRRSLVLRATGGGVTGNGQVPVQELFYAGGPVSGPGYAYHQFRATALASGKVELRTPIPFPGLPLGRWGRLPGSATLAPFAGIVTPGSDDEVKGHPFIGVGLLPFLDLLRIDVARGLRDGRWRFAIDVNRDFWSIL